MTELSAAQRAALSDLAASVCFPEDEAYAGYFDMEQSIVTETGRQVFADTTSADGFVTRNLPAGDWWVNTRIRVPVGEYVWNLKIDPSQVADTLRLDVSNGEERVRL